eukprot:scaffold102576_cov66-Phaeocystis_antarctica.AAC.4
MAHTWPAGDRKPAWSPRIVPRYSPAVLSTRISSLVESLTKSLVDCGASSSVLILSTLICGPEVVVTRASVSYSLGYLPVAVEGEAIRCHELGMEQVAQVAQPAIEDMDDGDTARLRRHLYVGTQ